MLTFRFLASFRHQKAVFSLPLYTILALLVGIGLTTEAQAGTTPQPAYKGQLVTTRCIFPTSSFGPAGTVTKATYRTLHKFLRDSQQIRLVYCNSYSTGGSGESNVCGLITLKAMVEYNGMKYPAFFNGQRSVSIAPGSTVTSDPIVPSVITASANTCYVDTFVDAGQVYSQPTGISFGAGTMTLTDTNYSWGPNQWANYVLVVTGGTGAGQLASILSSTANTLTIGSPAVPLDGTSTYTIVYNPNNLWPISIQTQDNNSGEGWIAGNDYSDPTAPTVPALPGINCLAPIEILGITATPNLPVIGVVGDSIMDGTSNTATTPDGFSARQIFGWVDYFTQTSGIPNLRVARFSEAGNTFNGPGGTLRKAFLSQTTHIIDDYGDNDIVGGLSLTQLKSLALARWAAFHAMGHAVYACTCVPQTRSTDQWTTIANQSAWTGAMGGTALPALGQGDGRNSGGPSIRTLYNDWLRNYAGNNIGNQIDGVIDLADMVETFRNSGIWKPATLVQTLGGGGANGTLTISGYRLSLTGGSLPPFTPAQFNGDIALITGGPASGQPFAPLNGRGTSNSISIAAGNCFSPTSPANPANIALIYNPWTVDGGHPSTSAQIYMASQMPALF